MTTTNTFLPNAIPPFLFFLRFERIVFVRGRKVLAVSNDDFIRIKESAIFQEGDFRGSLPRGGQHQQKEEEMKRAAEGIGGSQRGQSGQDMGLQEDGYNHQRNEAGMELNGSVSTFGRWMFSTAKIQSSSLASLLGIVIAKLTGIVHIA